MCDLEQKGHVVITGGGGGIGRGIARIFSLHGWSVTLIDFRQDALQQAVEELELAFPESGRFSYYVADLASPVEPTRAIRSVWNEIAPIDVLVNGAGIYPSTPLSEMTADVWDAVLDINLRAAVLTSVAFASLAEGRQGSNVVNITSGAARRARFGAAPYATSKAALEMFTKASALEYGPVGIRVNAVAPGYVAVDSPVNPSSGEYRAKVGSNPLNVEGMPSDIGEAVFWISSQSAKWITGATLAVDGGSSSGNSSLPRSWSSTALGSRDPLREEQRNA